MTQPVCQYNCEAAPPPGIREVVDKFEDLFGRQRFALRKALADAAAKANPVYKDEAKVEQLLMFCRNTGIVLYDKDRGYTLDLERTVNVLEWCAEGVEQDVRDYASIQLRISVLASNWIPTTGARTPTKRKLSRKSKDEAVPPTDQSPEPSEDDLLDPDSVDQVVPLDPKPDPVTEPEPESAPVVSEPEPANGQIMISPEEIARRRQEAQDALEQDKQLVKTYYQRVDGLIEQVSGISFSLTQLHRILLELKAEQVKSPNAEKLQRDIAILDDLQEKYEDLARLMNP